jgi:hypothetical protein
LLAIRRGVAGLCLALETRRRHPDAGLFDQIGELTGGCLAPSGSAPERQTRSEELLT